MPTPSERSLCTRLLGRAACVLFDFDGPICSLFAGHPARYVAARLAREVEGRGVDLGETAHSPDPLVLLRACAALEPSAAAAGASRIATRLLMEQEVIAVGKAEPTPHAEALVGALVLGGRRVAVTSNNSAEAISEYLGAHLLLEAFGEHVYGRAANPDLLKPDPYCVERAVEALGASPAECLMIGDSPADVVAARTAGVPFLGYASAPLKERGLREAGALDVVRSLLPLVEASLALGPVAPVRDRAPSSVPGC